MKESKQKQTKLQRFSLFFYDNVAFSLILWAAVLVFGVLSYSTFLPREGFPTVNVPISVVGGVYFVDDKEKVDSDVARPISEAIKAIPEVSEVTSNASDNQFSATVQYKEGTSSQEGSALVEKALKEVKLPSEAQIQFSPIEPTKFKGEFDLIVTGYSRNQDNSAVLEDSASLILPKLQNASGIASASVIEQSESGVNPANGETTTQQTIFDRVGIAANNSLSFYSSVGIGVVKDDSVDALGLYDNVSQVLSQNKDSSLEFLITANYADSIREQVSGLQKSLLEGIAVVIAVSLILISWRAGIATAVSMITVLALTVTTLWLIGYTLNTITLFALILCLGLIVDDTTIVAEAIDAGKRKGEERRRTVETAVKRVARASMAGTFTTILAFAPMLFIGGVLGDFIRALPVTIIVSLLYSLLISLSLIPFLGRKLILGGDQFRKPSRLERIVSKIEGFTAGSLAAILLWTKPNNRRKTIACVAIVIITFANLFGSAYIFGKLKFDIFPATKDSNAIQITVNFPQNTDIASALQLSDQLDTRINEVAGSYITRASYDSSGNKENVQARLQLVSYTKRDITAPQIAEKLQRELSKLGIGEVRASQIDAGPPKEEYPFQVFIVSEDATKATKLASDIESELSGLVVPRPNNTTATVTRTEFESEASVARLNGKRQIVVRAGFDADDSSTLVTATQDVLETKFNSAKLSEYGLTSESLVFDFGNESENQESFSSMITAFPILMIAMFVLLAVQFKSFMQPILIFMAIPFSWLGVALGLYITDNALSFFVMIGFFALIGIAVNNTILLTDFANQARNEGAGRIDAMSQAIRTRFRPLITTSLTSVVALIPLALSDPFWESLAVTLIFGLLSSMIFVLITFPYYYLAAELLRDVTVKLLRNTITKIRRRVTS